MDLVFNYPSQICQILGKEIYSLRNTFSQPCIVRVDKYLSISFLLYSILDAYYRII